MECTVADFQIRIGENRCFTFDYTFDTDSRQDTIYETCVKELVEGTFDGYNATVLAYGQVSFLNITGLSTFFGNNI